MALTFERKPDKGGETNHIGCIGIAAEGAEPTVLLLRTGTDEARCAVRRNQIRFRPGEEGRREEIRGFVRDRVE